MHALLRLTRLVQVAGCTHSPEAHIWLTQSRPSTQMRPFQQPGQVPPPQSWWAGTTTSWCCFECTLSMESMSMVCLCSWVNTRACASTNSCHDLIRCLLAEQQAHHIRLVPVPKPVAAGLSGCHPAPGRTAHGVSAAARYPLLLLM
jgi:hypothetical protein